MDERRAQIPGSAPETPVPRRRLSDANPAERVSATIVLRRRQDSLLGSNLEEELLSGRFQPIERTEAAAKIGAHPDDLNAVRLFANEYGLTIAEENASARTIRVTGTVQQIDRAFNIQLAWFEDAEGRRYLSYDGTLSVPETLSPIITAVLGLDQRPVAKHRAPEREP